ncbi:Aldehyde dehydrogenase [Galdieria sulphuraria]|uniref:Aldehyde dehydrogenase (NAD+) n=1 Tax=Galdieria sulphuraria TaxID=130081 RepID=M2VUN4_GALSU|nr:aldehyde dehydrogenase (NAD+) [Galdieria sulphuraria]EME26886.1 aldehyde dehydrogenase (NAD+) [Galdieria sulphuraria]GJD10650.1 Aldehyde dehydrogenase [Galdieria sulphuraria]|eukprot:XP_005703406.1 aldehyde dehydrogenase (NAD+) [Galdieria sulphuraria]
MSEKVYSRPGEAGCLVSFRPKYDNFIGNQWIAPVRGNYFDNVSPVDGKVFCQCARSTAEDVEVAMEHAYKGWQSWKKTSAQDRAKVLYQIAQVMDENREKLAVAEVWDNGKPIREALLEDIPDAATHFRYFAGAIATQEGFLSEINETLVAYHFHEPLGVVGLIIPWNYPILMASWKLAPAIAAGNCAILKPAEQTPASILVLMELLMEVIPPGVINVINGYGPEVGKPLALHPKVKKIAFTGETATGQEIMKYVADNIIPVTLELGGKSPNIFFEDIMDKDDGLLEKAIEGAMMFLLNQGEVCTCPSRALVQESILERFLERMQRVLNKIRHGDPLNTSTIIGAQVSLEQVQRIKKYIKIGKAEGAKCITISNCKNDSPYQQDPCIFLGNNHMRVFQEEIFGPVLCICTFQDEDDAIQMANDSSYGLAAGVWTRDNIRGYRVSRQLEAGRVWLNCYNEFPAHSAFGGYKKSGFGRECHKIALEHYQQIKNVIVNYKDQPLELF